MQQVSLGVRMGLRRIIARQPARRSRGHRAGDGADRKNGGPRAALPHRFDRAIEPDRSRGAAPGPARPLTALLELGVDGGRTGCRTVADAMQLARAIAVSRSVRLSGVRVLRGIERHRRQRSRPHRRRTLDARGATLAGSAMRNISTAPRRSRFPPADRRCSTSSREASRCSYRDRCARSCAAAVTSPTIRASTSVSPSRSLRAAAPCGENGRDSSRHWNSGRTSSHSRSPGLQSWRSANATRRSISICRCRSRAFGTEYACRSMQPGG